MLHNVPAYAMFASGIIARSAYHWQIWVEACGGTEQAVTAYAVLYDVCVFLYSLKANCLTKERSDFVFPFYIKSI